MDAAFKSLLADTFGSAYIGAMVALALYGITTLQTYLYFNYYPNDNWGLKSLVAVVWIAETVQIALVNRFMYIYLIDNFGNPLALIQGHWTLYVSIIFNVFIASIVQIYFATRIHTLAKKYWLTALISIFILAHIAFGIETVVRIFQFKFFTDLPKIEFNSALPFAITAVIPDVLISASLCFFLKNGKDNIAGIRSTEVMINLLIKYAVNRALLTSAAAILELILYAVLPNTFAFLAVDFCIGKLFANTLLGTLNARKYVRGVGTDAVISHSGSGGSSNARTFGSNAFRATPVQVQISGTVRSDRDYSERSLPDGYQLDSFDGSGKETKFSGLDRMV
ncbi:hypothetical protein SCHPADRAFT_940682 [Schizopora paradoxa]|uniref:DUF6534 domain-containing protein n=1 Tax=Schizopora paradoxa TaxID=27342 RepID=A0A0H2RMD1_9AGAM|nr:hypothetical protein SCHPADRAFT_940682 [Schizopora paradoxa]